MKILEDEASSILSEVSQCSIFSYEWAMDAPPSGKMLPSSSKTALIPSSPKTHALWVTINLKISLCLHFINDCQSFLQLVYQLVQIFTRDNKVVTFLGALLCLVFEVELCESDGHHRRFWG